MKAVAIVSAMLIVGAAAACSFSQYAQEKDLTENIDDYRTGCVVDDDFLLEDYLQWDANRYHFGGGATPTPSPADDLDLLTKLQLKTVWEHGCVTGRRDATNAKQASVMGLRDQLSLLDERIKALEPTPTSTPTSTPTATPTPN